MKDFYSELEVKPDATSEEIKESYRRLAKEYHPDRLPPGTPEKARRYIEEKFKSLQEAYSVLSDPVKRKAYDSQRLSQTKGNERDLGLKAKPSYSTQDGSTWPFDPDKIQKAAKEIERRKESIEVNYNQKIEQVKSELRKNLISIGIKQEEAKIDSTFHTGGCAKLFSLLFLLFVALSTVSVIASFPNPSVDEWFESLYGSLFWLAIAIFLFYHYHYRKEYYTKQQVESARRFQDEAKKSIEQLERDKNAKLSQIQLYCRSRIDYFKSLPLESLSPEFISGLSGEDQLFLLTAIKEKADAEKLKEDLKLAAGVAVGIGILAVLFGLGGGFYPH